MGAVTVTVTVNVARIVWRVGLAAALILLVNKVNDEGATQILEKAVNIFYQAEPENTPM